MHSQRKIAAGPGWVVILGPLEDNATHRHHALQFVIARSGHVQLDDQPPARNVLIGSDQPHWVCADDALTFLLDPETDVAHMMGTLLAGGACGTDVGLDVERVAQLVGRSADTHRVSRSVDTRIAEVLGWMRECAAAGAINEITLDGALKRTQLSESRFLHLFRQHAGITWRRGVIWVRALAAMRHVSEGMNLTTAAHHADYADSAHFSRQFKELFGFTPSAVSRSSRFVQVEEILGEYLLP